MGVALSNLLRSILLHFSIVALPLVLTSGLVLGACGSSDRMSSPESSAGTGEPMSPPGPTTSFNTGDAASDEEGTSRGSPLCGFATDECIPDDDGTTELAAGAAPCATSPDAGVDVQYSGCRIAKTNDKVGPQCGAADPNGTDGVSCNKGSDCAPGFDCVEGEQGPVCHRYCCTGTCESQSSRNGGPTFCDIRTLVDPNLAQHMAPVCMPIKTCRLLREGECGDKETCAVVTEKGDTGCVPRGDAKAGESCDNVHCDENLTCLGSPGDRRCYKLCRVDGADCNPMMTCTTGSVFQDTTFGVCKED
ncbi:MAG: hypothetical protein K0S65_2610 [Labilithrix sp.]|nr:hypothetical protein [Labilithrix sp.]